MTTFTATIAPRRRGAYMASQNGAKIRAILEAGTGYADLYRTITAGPSGQRGDLLVGRVRYLPYGKYEFAILNPTDGELIGYAWREHEGWAITERDYDGALHWRGYASALSVGVDVLVHGEFAALRSHDCRRIGSGWLRKPGGAR